MAVYFDYKVNIDSNLESVQVQWHPQLPLLAVCSNTTDESGTVTICDDLGEPIPDITFPLIVKIKVNQISWHPSRKILVAGWSSGVLRVWLGGSEFLNVANAHVSSILQLDWSNLGSRLACLDERGTLSSWTLNGNNIPILSYKITLQGEPSCFQFLNVIPGLDVNDLAKKAVAGDERALDMFSAWRPRTAGRRPTVQSDNITLFVGTLSG